MDTVRDVERIGDHFENIIELIDYKISNKVIITEYAQEDLNNMFDLTISTVKQAVKSLEQMDREEALAVIQKEREIDTLERNYRKKHIIRMNEGLCDGSAGIVFVDILSNLERIGDHAVNIAEDRKSTRLNSSHVAISYAVFCLKKKKHKKLEREWNISPVKCQELPFYVDMLEL